MNDADWTNTNIRLNAEPASDPIDASEEKMSATKGEQFSPLLHTLC